MKWKKQKTPHYGNNSKMATKNTTLWEQFQNDKKIPQYGNNSKMKSKKYHIHTMGTIPKRKNKNYHTMETIPKLDSF